MTTELVTALDLFVATKDASIASQILRDFDTLQPIDQIQVCQTFKSKSLTYTTLLKMIDNPAKRAYVDFFVKMLVENFYTFSPNQQTALIEGLTRFVNNLFTQSNGDRCDSLRIVNAVLQGFVAERTLYKTHHQAIHILISCLLRLVEENISRWCWILEKVFMIEMYTGTLTDERFNRIWTLATVPNVRVSIADFYVVHRAEVNDNNALVPLPTTHRVLFAYYDQTIASQNTPNGLTGGYYNGSHNVHLLDAYRTKYLQRLHALVPIIKNEDLVNVNQAISKLSTSNPNTIYGINEVQGYVCKFKLNDQVSLTMDDVFKRIVLIINRIKNPEVQKTAFKRLEEELLDMRGKCISGHINRLFNCTFGIVEADILNYDLLVKEHVNQFLQSDLPEDVQESLLEALMMPTVFEENPNIKIYVYQAAVTLLTKLETLKETSETMYECFVALEKYLNAPFILQDYKKWLKNRESLEDLILTRSFTKTNQDESELKA